LKRGAKYLEREGTTIAAVWEKDSQQLLVFSDYHTANEKCSLMMHNTLTKKGKIKKHT
jgi:hypothetical protein